MKLGQASKEGIVYQITDDVDGVDVVIDIMYSGDKDDDGNSILEFEWAEATADANPKLDEEELRVVNKILECGMEEKYVKCLVDYYKDTEITFSPNHYEF